MAGSSTCLSTLTQLHSVSGLVREWPFSDVLTDMLEVSAELSGMAQPLFSCALSSRTSSHDAGSAPGKQKLKGLSSHTVSHTTFCLSKQVTGQPGSKEWGNRPHSLMAGAEATKLECKGALTQGPNSLGVIGILICHTFLMKW